MATRLFYLEVKGMARVSVVTRLTRREYEALRLLAVQEARSLSGCVRFLVRRTLEERGLLKKFAQDQQETLSDET